MSAVELVSCDTTTTVLQLRFDHALTLITDDLQLRIGMSFRFTDHAGKTVFIDPEDFVSTGAPAALFALLNASVESLTFSAVGLLTVAIAGGAQIIVEPSTQYEAWTISGPGTRLLVCTLHGAVAEWPDTTSTAGR